LSLGRYEEYRQDIRSYPEVLARLIHIANYARILGDADTFVEAVEALYDTLPPKIRENLEKEREKLEKEFKEILARIKEKTYEIDDPINQARFYTCKRAQAYKKYASILLKMIIAELDKAGLLLSKQTLFQGGSV